MSIYGVFPGPFLVFIWTEYGDLQSKFLYSVRIRENADQKKLRIWTLFAHVEKHDGLNKLYRVPCVKSLGRSVMQQMPGNIADQ